MALTDALQAAQFGKNGSHSPPGKKPFLGKHWEPQLSAGMDDSIDPDKSCNYCKDTGHDICNCLHLQKQKAILVRQQQQGEG